MRILVSALLLAFALNAAAADYWFEPAGPTSHSVVKLHVWSLWPSVCTPQHAEVTTSENVVEVRWTSGDSSGCLSVGGSWEDEVVIGTLDPGVHEVRFYVDEFEIFQRERLIVSDGKPRLRLVPSAVSIRGGDTVMISSADPEERCFPVTDVRVDGVVVPVTKRGNCDYVFAAPPLPVGTFDVTAKVDRATLTATAGLRSVDPAAAPDDAALERLLVPLLYEGAGAYGSQWMTEGKLTLVGTTWPVQWLPDVLNAECASGACSGNGVVDLTSFGNHPAGLLLFLPRGFGDIATTLSVRETTKGGTWGVPVPVVREKDYELRFLRFPNIPFGPQYRATLRIYGVDGKSGLVYVTAGGAEQSALVRGTCGTPCNTARPAFAAVNLQQAFPALQGAFDVAVEVELGNRGPRSRYWAFVSVTDNETQQVTVIPPQ